MSTLHSDPYVTITLDTDVNVVFYRRSAEPYPSIETLRAVNQKLFAAFAAVPDSMHILIDVRNAPARNDDAFEHEIIDALRGLAKRFAGHATLVKGAVGRLQVNRMLKETHNTVGIFSDEAQALAYLKSLDR